MITDWLRQLRFRFRALFRKRTLEADMAEELRVHLEMEAAANEWMGLAPEEARYAALRQFGGADQVKEDCREQRGLVGLEQFGKDLRFAARSLAKSPGFSFSIVAMLALGIGASTAVFSIVNTVVLRPLAFPNAERLVAVRVVLPALAQTYPTLPVNARFYQEWRPCPEFSDLALIDRGRSTMTGAGEPVRVSSVRASTNLFATLRVTPSLGRSFAAGEDAKGKSSVVILSDRFWRNRFSGDPAILGRTLTLDLRPVTVIGVLPADFRLPEARQFSSEQNAQSSEPEVFLPKIIESDEFNDILGCLNYEVVGRLAAGVAPATATVQLSIIATRLAKLSGSNLAARGFIAPLHESIVGPVRRGPTGAARYKARRAEPPRAALIPAAFATS